MVRALSVNRFTNMTESRSIAAWHNKWFDRSGGSVFRIKPGAAKVE